MQRQKGGLARGGSEAAKGSRAGVWFKPTRETRRNVSCSVAFSVSRGGLVYGREECAEVVRPDDDGEDALPECELEEAYREEPSGRPDES